MWGRGHSNCNASLSQPNVQKNSPCEEAGGLKFEKKINVGKKIKSTPKKKLGIARFPCILYFFIHP